MFLSENSEFETYMETKGSKYHFNLWEINSFLMRKEGMEEKNIEFSNLCTKCNSHMFFSHRGQGGKRGLLAGIIMMK
ncbi:MAG TPA: hypothetical protein DEF04_06880 [Clostridiales bacterium]|nr:hypothetical protein [Clostridiales bacterium]